MTLGIGGLSLHDGEMPLRQLGLGSRRMLTTGLQRQASENPHITLFDEVEIGLEPHRIARLVHHLKDDTSGQYFITTHSPVVLRELAISDLHVVHSKDGVTDVVSASQPTISDSLQGKIRHMAEAFLSPKIIVCEGATEIGFLKGMDRYWISKGRKPFAYQGIGFYDANGASNIKGAANQIRELQYDVAVLADSDAPNEFSEANADALRAKGMTVVMWSGEISIEELVFSELPWVAVIASVGVAREFLEEDRILTQIQTHYGSGFCRDSATWTDEPRLRIALGKAANASEWFKRQDKAYRWAGVIAGSLETVEMKTSDLLGKLTILREWIDRA
jgi:hypothetical protein